MREFACRAAAAACLLGLITLGGAGCHREPAAPAQEAWSVDVTSALEPVGATTPGATLCVTEGQACSALTKGATFKAGGRIKTVRGARASFQLDSATSLAALDEASVGVLNESTRALDVAEGNLLFRREAGGGSPSKPMNLRVAGSTIEVAADTAVTASIRTYEGGRASVTVRQGSVAIRSAAGVVSEIRAGETARLTPGEAVDRRAGWQTGGEAPADLVTSDELSDRAPSVEPRGLGTITARAPGTEEVVSGVRLVSHMVSVVCRDGFARTEVEEEFFNDTPRVLEGRFVFPLPADASVARLALWVGSDLVEGEILERKLAATIFKGIVDDTVRPRDPALLEWVSGGEFSLKIFPLPAKGSRKVVLAYNQALPVAGGRVRYVYPLSLGADRTAKIDDLSISLTALDSSGRVADATTHRYPASIRMEDGKLEVGYSARSFAPGDDFVVSYERRESEGDTEVSAYTPRAGELGGGPGGYVAIRTTADLPSDAPLPPRVRRDVALVIDASHGQSIETLEGEEKLALGLIQQMDPDERFVILTCDSACSAYPASGTLAPTAASIEGAGRFLRETTPGGSADIAGALLDAASRVPSDGSGQIVYIGGGSPSAGELSAEAIGARVKPALDARKADLRLLGAGRTVDEVVFEGLAQATGATYERVSTGEALEARAASIGLGLRAPVIRGAALDVPSSLTDVYPQKLPGLRLGQPVTLVARALGEAPSSITIRGELGGAPYVRAKTVVFDKKSTELDGGNPIVPRLWAEARIREIEASGDGARVKESIELSKRFHVMSRSTSLLVLENDRMFAEFGIQRTTRKAGDQSDQSFSDVGGSAGGAGGGGAKGAAAPSDARRAGLSGVAKESGGLSAVGHFWGSGGSDSSADSFGAGGLGLSGVGEGGGGRGEGIGLGSIGTIGRGASIGNGQGFGSGWGRLRGDSKSSSPRVRMGATTVSGRLPPEVVQRIVRQNFGRFRLCYENGLRLDPGLGGRVTVRFVIGRDGAVAAAQNGGSDLPSDSVISCVVRSFSSLAFPQPEGGIVTVTYPIVFTNESSAPPTPPRLSGSTGWMPGGWVSAEGPRASHAVADAGWASSGEEALAKLRKGVEEAPMSRKRHEALVRGLLSRGRFQEALTRAMRFAEMDPDLPTAREVLAFAAAASGDGALALRSVDGLSAMSPRKGAPHLRAARAFEAAGDERRACAHWRSLASLASSADDAAVYESLRCRARVLDGTAAVLGEARAMARRPSSVDRLVASLEEGKLPRYEAKGASGGALEASLSCSAPSVRCPTAVVLGPDGSVYSAWTPAPLKGGTSSVSLASVVDGTYRTLLVGGEAGAEGELKVRVFGSVKKAPLSQGGRWTTLATTVSGVTPGGFGLFGGFG